MSIAAEIYAQQLPGWLYLLLFANAFLPWFFVIFLIDSFLIYRILAVRPRRAMFFSLLLIPVKFFPMTMTFLVSHFAVGPLKYLAYVPRLIALVELFVIFSAAHFFVSVLTLRILSDSSWKILLRAALAISIVGPLVWVFALFVIQRYGMPFLH